MVKKERSTNKDFFIGSVIIIIWSLISINLGKNVLNELTPTNQPHDPLPITESTPQQPLHAGPTPTSMGNIVIEH